MADGVAITAGAGTTILTDDTGAGGHAQVVKLAISTDGSGTLIPADAANGIDVDVTRLPALATGSNVIGALTANQSVNVAQINGVTTSMGNGASGTGVQRVTIANDSTGQVALAGTPATTLTGVAEDAALSGNGLRQLVRSHTGVPAAMSADNDGVTPWADANGATVVVPQLRTKRITLTPTISNGAIYAAGDVVGAALTLTGAALASGRAGRIKSAVLLDKGKQNAALELWIFLVSPTLVNADNGVFDISDANQVAAIPKGVIDFTTANYRNANVNSVCTGTNAGAGGVDIPFTTSGSANLFAAFVTRGTPTYTSTTDLVCELEIDQY